MNNYNQQPFIQNLTPKLKELCQNLDQDSFTELINCTQFTEMSELFNSYLNFLRNDNGSLSAFWMTYIDTVEIMLNLLRASREANWTLYLSSIRSMILWCFPHDRINYARYLSAYYAEMSNLSIEHPDVQEYFSSGGFSIQHGATNSFGRISADQTIEETINKDTQKEGGTKGFSLKTGAISKFYLTAAYPSSYLYKVKDMLDLNQLEFHHQDLQATRISRDEHDVQNLVVMLENNWIKPFI